MTAEDARAALTGSLGGDPDTDPGAVLEDGPAPLCNAPCKGLYGASTLCELPKGHQPPCAPAVMSAAAERESQRRLDHSYASAGMTATSTRPQTSVTDRVTALAEWWASNPSAVRIALNEEGFPRPTANVSHEIELISRLAVHLRNALELEAGDPGPAGGTREQAEALIKRACDILATLDGHGPVDLEAMHLDPDHLTVLAALRDSLRPPADEPAVEPSSASDLLDYAWTIIANAGWNGEPKATGWDEAAVRFRDLYHQHLGVAQRHQGATNGDGPVSQDATTGSDSLSAAQPGAGCICNPSGPGAGHEIDPDCPA